MTAWFLIVAALGVVVASAFATGSALRRKRAGTSRRAEALADVARRVDAAVGSLAAPAPVDPGRRSSPAPAPAVDGGTGGRAALVDAAVEQVAAARENGARLAAASVRTPAGIPVSALVDLVETPVYVVGADAFAFLLPGHGRADALGVLARLEAHLAASGRAVELEPGESAAALVTRLLGSSPRGLPPRSLPPPGG